MRQSIINGVLEKPFPKLQARLGKTFTASEQNKWYTVLDAKNVRLYVVRVLVDIAETIEVKATIDGNVYTGITNATAGTIYNIHIRTSYAGSLGYTTDDGILFMFRVPLDTRHIKIEFRKTTANGTSALNSSVVYAQW